MMMGASMLSLPLLLPLALQAIKLWAEVRGVYSNVSGYLGGVNMALMVARICKWYPAKSAANIVHNFFMVGVGWAVYGLE
jgi:poly(A) polymerase